MEKGEGGIFMQKFYFPLKQSSDIITKNTINFRILPTEEKNIAPIHFVCARSAEP